MTPSITSVVAFAAESSIGAIEKAISALSIIIFLAER